MSIQHGPGLANLLKAVETGQLTSIKKTVQIAGSPFEDMAGLRPPVLGLPPSPGLEVLRRLFGLAIRQPTPVTRGLFELMARGALSPQMVDYIIANRLTIDHLRREALMLRPQLGFLPTPGFVMGHAVLDLIQRARHFGDLTDSPAVRARIGGLVAERLAAEMTPFEPALRPAIVELLTTGGLSPNTLKKLGRRGAKQLAARLRRELPTIKQLPAVRPDMLAGIVTGAAGALRRDADASAEAVRQAVRQAMSPADRKTFDADWSFRANPQFEAAGSFEAKAPLPKLGLPGVPEGSGSLIQKAFEALPAFDHAGEIGLHQEGKLEGHLAGSYDGALGQASFDAKANVHASVDAHAKGSIKFDGQRLDMEAELGARVELGAEATVKAQANLFNGAVKFDGTATGSVKAEAHANAAGSLSVGFDENGLLNVHAKGSADIGASLEASGRVAGSANIAGIGVSGEAYGGVMIGLRAAASGEFGYKDGRVSAGFRFKLAIGVGIDFGFKFSFTVPQWARDLGGSIKNVASAVTSGVTKVAQSVGNAVKSVGNAVANVGKAIGNFFSGL